MKRRPSSSFLVCIAVVVVLGGIGFWFLSKLKAFPVHQWRSLTFSEILRGETGYTPEEKAANRKRIEELKQKIVAEFPDLVIQEKPVPDERNGFRQLYDFGEDMEKGRVRATLGLREQLDSTDTWESTAMRAALAENGELIARIESIAALQDRSSANMPESYNGFFSSRHLKMAADILLAKARLAAEAKDEEETLRLVNATLNLASHLDQVEAPNFLSSTMSVMIDRQVDDAIMKKFLPALGRDADPSRWRSVLATRPVPSTDTFVRMLRAEWSSMMTAIMVPAILESDLKTSPTETDEGIRAIASQYDFWVHQLRARHIDVLLSLPKSPPPPSRISPDMRSIVDGIRDGCESWGRGYVRAASARAMTIAALDLLILEKSGATLTADSVSKVAPEPLTGHTFLFDLATRTLTAPSSLPKDINVKPLVLPW